MRLIGVIDLLDGRAVHARRGERGSYAPVAGSDGDPVTLARTYIDELGLRELYVADLDAILGRPPQDSIVSALCALDALVWLDAGVASAARARQAHRLGVTHVVVGLETLPSYEALDAICDVLGGDCVAFSLDLRDGQPIGSVGTGQPPPEVAARAAAAGVNSIIVIDLARVGTEGGVDLEMLHRIRDAAPTPLLFAGGGVRGLDDLAGLADAGCDGALLATALHTSRLGATEIKAARHFSVRR